MSAIAIDDPGWRDDGPSIRIRHRTLIAVVITFLLHCLLIYVFIHAVKPIIIVHEKGEEGTLVYVEDNGHPAPKHDIEVPKAAPKPVQRSHNVPKPKVSEQTPTPTPTPTTTPIATPTPTPMAAPPTEDLGTLIAMRRAQRQAIEQQGRDPSELPQQTEDQRRDEIIRRNLARPGTSGVFQILHMEYSTASFSFRGWTGNTSNAHRQVIDVQAEASEDIRHAIVRRMIALIRTYYQGDFNWESERLGRTIVLSARPEDNAGLEEFMMREFFGSRYSANSY
jgi:hypothetical protein